MLLSHDIYIYPFLFHTCIYQSGLFAGSMATMILPVNMYLALKRNLIEHNIAKAVIDCEMWFTADDELGIKITSL